MASYGLIVEGVYDGAIYQAFIKRIDLAVTDILIREMGGIATLKRSFPAMLRDLEHSLNDEPVDRALVMRDADGNAPAALEQQLRTRISGQSYSFPRGVGVHCVVQAVETWLLADLTAIDGCAVARGGTPLGERDDVPEPIESLLNPKQLLSRLLCDAGVALTPTVCADIATRADLNRLRERCPSFVAWEAKVLAGL